MIAFRDEVEFSFFHLGRNPPLPYCLRKTPKKLFRG